MGKTRNIKFKIVLLCLVTMGILLFSAGCAENSQSDNNQSENNQSENNQSDNNQSDNNQSDNYQTGQEERNSGQNPKNKEEQSKTGEDNEEQPKTGTDKDNTAGKLPNPDELPTPVVITGEEEKNENSKTMSDVRTKPLGDGVMKIRYFDAGHADSFMIYTDHSAILIDAGEKGFGKNIIKFMEKEGIGKLDYMLITHFDKDHVGGAAKLVKNVQINQIYTGNYMKDSDEMFEFYDSVNEEEVPCQLLFDDIDFTIDGIHVEINVPERMVYEDAPSNNSSLIIRVTYRDKVFLFMGDAELSRIREYLSENPAVCDVLKVPYHGIYQGCLQELVDTVKPSYAVITSSKQEKEDEETRDILEKAEVGVYKTRKGDVEFTVDDDGLISRQ